MAKKEEKKTLTKAELEHEKLALENVKLRRETTKNLWWYLGKARVIIPIATLIVTVVVLYNQTRTEKRRVESETANQLAATVKDLDSSKSRSIRLGAVLSMENFIPLGQEYRGQIYLLLGNLLKEEAKITPRDSILIHHVCESFRKLSKVRLARYDAAIPLYLIRAKLGRLYLHLFDLRGADLREANLEGATLREARLDSARLWKASLGVANLEHAVLTEAELQEANLEGAYLRGANLENANLRRASLKEADLERARLRGAKNLTLEQLSEAGTLYETELDVSLLEQVKEKYPQLLEAPKK